jgi:outer membrane protein assembly factor BamE (lipoprotein component of BamABCDE complex)
VSLRRLIFLLLLLAAAGFLWNHRDVFRPTVQKEIVKEENALPLARKAARREKARIDQGRAVESEAAEESVKEGMTYDEVRRLLGDPNSVETDDRGNTTWHYDVIGQHFVFRHGRVWSVESGR